MVEEQTQEAVTLQQTLQQEVREELGVQPDTLPQFRQAEYAATEKMLKQKYGLIPPQLTDTEKLVLVMAEWLP